MKKIYWIDDQPSGIQELIVGLRNYGYGVDYFQDEISLMKKLENGYIPNVIIQDMERNGGSILPFLIGDSSDRSWEFYEKYLKLKFPIIPVMFCTEDSDYWRNSIEIGDYRKDFIFRKEIQSKQLATKIKLCCNNGVNPNYNLTEVNNDLVKILAWNPTLMYEMPPLKFEELIAKILTILGLKVEKTQGSRDGGVDIWAYQESIISNTLFAVEAKRYKKTMKVGVRYVRCINGILNTLIPKLKLLNNEIHTSIPTIGMIVTTSSFSKDAIKYGKLHEHRIKLVDFQILMNWLFVAYQKLNPNWIVSIKGR